VDGGRPAAYPGGAGRGRLPGRRPGRSVRLTSLGTAPPLRQAVAGRARAGLARRAGVPVSTLRDWEGDRGFPGPAAGLRLAEALGVTQRRLADGVEDPAEEEALAAEAEAWRRRKGKAP
jgi:transcriptional regulator with XRE-family HTH domain